MGARSGFAIHADGQGRATFTHVPAGSYTVVVRRRLEERRESVTVEEAGDALVSVSF